MQTPMTTQAKTDGIWTRIKSKVHGVKQGALDWIDHKIFNVIMSHINLEESILVSASKATTENFHLTSIFLVISYYIWRIEAKFKNWTAKKSK